MNDRFMRGVAAGSLAYIPTWIFNHTAFYFHFTKIRFSDFATFLIFGAPIKTNMEMWFSRFGTMFFLAICGAIFAFLVPQISSQYFLFKGWFFAVTVWYLCFSITKLFKVEMLSKMDLKTALSNLIAASIWGLITAYTMRFLAQRNQL